MWDWSSMNESISQLCGSPFWDSNRTWNSASPDFTPCFEKTALVWLPCIFLWLFSPLEIYFQYRSVLPRIPTNRFNLLKLACIAIIIWTTLIGAAVNYVHLDEKPSVVDFYVPIVRLFTFGFFFKLTHANIRCGVKSSWIPLLFSFLLIVCSTPQVRTEIRSGVIAHLLDGPRYEVVNCILFFVFYVHSFALFVLNCFADTYSVVADVPTNQNKCPEFDSSVLSRFTFAWFNPFIWKGYWKTLDTDDLWTLDDDLHVAKLSHQFQSNWESARDRRNKSKIRVNRSRPVENRTLLDDDGNQETVSDTDKGASIVIPLLQTFGSNYLYGAVFKIFHSSSTFGGPMLLNLIIDFIDDEKELLWHGVLYSVALLVYCVLRTLLMNQHFHIIYRLGLKISAALVAVIYKKALRISNGARREFTVGEIVNLMAVDAQRFKNSLFSISLMWGAPLEFGITFYLLWQVLGSSLLVGFGIWLLLLPLNYLLLSKCNKLQVEQMKRKDKRVKLMTEMLSGIKVLKLYAWESSFQDQIFRIRVEETDIIRKQCYIEVATTFLYNLAMILMSISSFAMYVLSNNQHVLDARVAFVSLILFQTLGSSLAQSGYIFSEFVPILVSLGRIRKFLNAEELDPRNVSHEARPEPVVIESGRFSWDSHDSSSTLYNVNVNVEAGKLVAVVGSVGSGKSSLLSAILGEMYVQAGHVNTTGTVAYVPQQAWIRNATLKNNITLGNETENAQSYSRIVEACALLPDIQILPGGDKTEIGEKGINLSGGQKQRVSLARAVYSEADTYLLDDPLSAVDSHVAKHIFEHVIGPNGLLKSKTRILATHNVTFLSRMDFIIVLKDGTVSESGTYEELVQREGEFAHFLATYVKDESNAAVDVSAATVQPEDESSMSESSKKTTQTEETANEEESHGHTLIETEETAIGNVGADVYKYYLGAMGLGLLALTISLNLMRQALGIGTNFWLSVWSSNAAAPDDPNRTRNEYFYLSVYSILGLSSAASVIVEGVVLVVGLVKAAKSIHNYLLTAVLRWPTLSFDKIPLGRIINRFSSDVDIVDNTLREIVMEFFRAVAQVMSTLIVVTYTTPIFTVALIPMVIFYYFVQRFFIATSRQLRRMESVSKSPIYSHFEETITGAQSIRSYNLQPKFIRDSEKLVDVNQKSSYLGFVVNRWLSVNLETVGSLIAFFAAIFAVLTRSTITAGLAGLSVSYAMKIANTLYYWVRMTAEAETNVVAIERIKKYIDMPQEAAWTLSVDRHLPANWPNRGEIVFQDFRVRYQTSLEPVLKGISFSVNSGEKVGIVGRTGAGKSSLTLSLFRIIESCGGQISIDHIDISSIGLHTLRSRLTIIPQDPVLFAGTLRVNLDPSDSFTDENLWSALEMVNLRTYLVNADMNLHSQVEEGGSNFSVGQRQLICLARALLRKTKVLILDEATAAVDMETDDVIQATIRKEFKDSTVLTIAHRLNTVMDYDRILVLDVGTIVEYDSPDTLLQSKESVFYGMATDAGLV